MTADGRDCEDCEVREDAVFPLGGENIESTADGNKNECTGDRADGMAADRSRKMDAAVAVRVEHFVPVVVHRVAGTAESNLVQVESWVVGRVGCLGLEVSLLGKALNDWASCLVVGEGCAARMEQEMRMGVLMVGWAFLVLRLKEVEIVGEEMAEVGVVVDDEAVAVGVVAVVVTVDALMEADVA